MNGEMLEMFEWNIENGKDAILGHVGFLCYRMVTMVDFEEVIILPDSTWYKNFQNHSRDHSTGRLCKAKPLMRCITQSPQ